MRKNKSQYLYRTILKKKPDMGINTELNNSIRQIERNTVHTKLIENQVIHTNNENENISYNNSLCGKFIQSDNNTVMVPKLPLISGLS